MWMQKKAQGEEMKLEVGKRYVLRNGEVTGPLIKYQDYPERYSADVGDAHRTWDESGNWSYDTEHGRKDLDIVSEYIEPKAFPRYFVGNLWTPADAYLRFDSRHKCVWVENTGTEVKDNEGEEWDCENPHETWREVTAEEAMARLIKPTQTAPANVDLDKPASI